MGSLSIAIVLLPGIANAGLLGGAPGPGGVPHAPEAAKPAAVPELPVAKPVAAPTPPSAEPGQPRAMPAIPPGSSAETFLPAATVAPAPAAPPTPAPTIATPAPVASPTAIVAPAATKTPDKTTDARPDKDELGEAGYLPGYRRAKSLGLSPYAPQVGGMPGGVTPAYGAPTPASNWTFKWNGYLSATLQASTYRRVDPLNGQSSTVFHVPPQTLDEYASFVGTSTMPGNWAALNFEYGNQTVMANFSINTWNPSQPSTYYQIGSQYFVNNAFLTFALPRIAGIGVRASAGYFYNTYGSLSQYGLGIYQNSIIGSPRGVGETVLAEYSINPSMSVVIEDGIIGNRTGKAPDGVVANSGNGGNANPIFPSAWVHHLHLGVVKKGDPTFRAQVHYMANWSQDDRTQTATDNPVTRQIDESHPRDGSIRIWGVDASVSHPLWGFLGVAGSYMKGDSTYTLRGLLTYGGDGAQLTDRWWGGPTGGTGTLAIAGVNYAVSLGKIVASPTPFNGDGPDILINTGFIIAKSSSTFELYDRVRHKYGMDVLYKFLPWLGAGIRGDRVVPTSLDSEETFHVISPRLVFRTDWQSRETVTLLYAKWFHGNTTHPEASSSLIGNGVSPTPVADLGKIDDQLIALNVNIWW
jgi:hypothetical protein